MGAGTVKFIKVPVTVLKVSGTARKKLTNTATVTCKVGGKDNPACKDTTSDDIFVSTGCSLLIPQLCWWFLP